MRSCDDLEILTVQLCDDLGIFECAIMRWLRDLDPTVVRWLRYLERPIVRWLRDLDRPIVRRLRDLDRPIVRWLRDLDLPIVFSLLRRDPLSLSVTISSSDRVVWFWDAIFRLSPQKYRLLIKSSGLQTRPSVFLRKNLNFQLGRPVSRVPLSARFQTMTVPFWLLLMLTRWSKFTVHYDLCRAYKMYR